MYISVYMQGLQRDIYLITVFNRDPKMFISIEGNIGAGKSTFLKLLDTELTALGIPHVCLQEPVDIWTQEAVNGKSMLELFYEDKAQYALSFQFLVLQTRVQQLLDCIKDNPEKVIITERCHITDKMIFANTMLKSGYLKPHEMLVYDMWYRTCSGLFSEELRGIVYLRSSPHISCERIIQRNRKGENNISLEYIKNLHSIHDEWIMEHEALSLPVHVMNANSPTEDMDFPGTIEFIRNACGLSSQQSSSSP